MQDDNGEVMGCHATKADAQMQMAALYANEPEASMSTITRARAGTQNWFRIENALDDASAVYIYDEVGAFGVAAGEFIQEIQSVKSKSLDVHLNSPGGGVFDGFAIFNALKKHPAEVTVHIDGLAASIASVIAMAGDRIVMDRYGQMMIHESHAIAAGSAKDMAQMAGVLDEYSDNIASVYAERAGGQPYEWRERMRAETWYSAAEAKRAGLVDEVTKAAKPVPKNSAWDLSIFNYAGRESAPDPFAPRTELRGEAGPELVDLPSGSVVVPHPPPGPQAQPDPPDEAGFLMPALDLAALRAAIHDEPLIPFDPEIFQAMSAVIQAVANDAPAPPTPTAPPEPADEPGFVIDLSALRRSLREATL